MELLLTAFGMPLFSRVTSFTHSLEIRARLGGNVRAMITGAAPISATVVEFLQVCFSAPVIQGYGQTENSASASISILGDPEIGHIGCPLPSVMIKLRDVPEMNYTTKDKPYPRGEICVKGAPVFKGYYKAPEKTGSDSH